MPISRRPLGFFLAPRIASVVGEKAMPGKLEFVSVFDPTKRETGPRVPGGKEFDVPEVVKLSPADEKKRAKNPPPRPDFSGVELLAKEVANPENRQFAKNAAFRLGYLDYKYSHAFSGWHISPAAAPGQTWEDAYDLNKNPMLQYGFPATVKTTYASIEVKF